MDIYDCEDFQEMLNNEELNKDHGQKNYDRYLELHGSDRLMKRLYNGRSVQPCNRECRKYGEVIAETNMHTSFENFKNLMDDEEFCIGCALKTPDPLKCENYFLKYVNVYLKNKPEFRLNFLRNVYLNKNVLSLESINYVVETFNMKKENKKLLKDYELKKEVEAKIYLIHSLLRVSENTKHRLTDGLKHLIESFNCVEPEIDLRDELGIYTDDLSEFN